MKNTIHRIIKAVLLITIYCSLNTVFGQAPQKMSYQAVIRNSNGDLLSNSNVSIDITIFQGSSNGGNVYEELHNVSTNTNGLATVIIGDGLVSVGSFNDINWENGPYFLSVAIDPNGGGNFTITSTSQLVSVPYAQMANKSMDNYWKTSFGLGGIVNLTPNSSIGNDYRIGIGTNIPSAKLEVNGKSITSELEVTNNTGIGINTPNPNAYGYFGTSKVLEISNDIFATNSQSQLVLSSEITNIGNIGGVTFVDKDAPTSDLRMAAITSQYNDDVLDYDTDGVNELGGSLDFWTNKDGIFSQKMKISINGNVGIGTTTPTAKLEVNGFTKLGTDAPSVKIKKLTGITGPNQGDTTIISPGLDLSKILSVSILIEYQSGSFMPPIYTLDLGYEYNYWLANGAINIKNKLDNSSQILSKPIKILITYEE